MLTPNMELIKELSELNLDDNEIKVYQSCLRLGSAKVHDISKEAELIRTTTYGVLKSLTEKGLISTILRDNVTHYQATNPKELLNILEEKKEKINSILPKLESMTNVSSPFPKVNFFEGEKGLRTIFNNLLKPNTSFMHIGVVKEWMDLAKVATMIYYRKKKDFSITSRSIVPDTKIQREASKHKMVRNAQFKFTDIKIKGSMFVTPTNVSFVSYQGDNLRGFIIEDKEYVRLQTQMFEKLWKAHSTK